MVYKKASTGSVCVAAHMRRTRGRICIRTAKPGSVSPAGSLGSDRITLCDRTRLCGIYIGFRPTLEYQIVVQALYGLGDTQGCRGTTKR